MQSSENIDQIAAALASVQGNCKMVGKSALNKFDGYRYADLEDYLAVIKPELYKEGLAVITSMATLSRLENRKTRNGGDDNVVQAELDITIVHKSGQWIRARMYGEGQDRADKSIYKATTGARKYAIASLFNLATSDDPERDESVGTNRFQATPQQAVTRAASPANSLPVAAQTKTESAAVATKSSAVGKAPVATSAGLAQAPTVTPSVATSVSAENTPVAEKKSVPATKKATEKEVVKTADGGTLVGHSGDPVESPNADDMNQKCTANCSEMEDLRKEFQRMKITSRQHCLSIVNWALGRTDSNKISVVTDMTRADAKTVRDKIVASGDNAVRAFLQKAGLLETVSA